MKLKDLMQEYLELEDAVPDRLKLMSESLDISSTPCNVAGKSTWQSEESEYVKHFDFPDREPLRSFCSYILDLEGQSGTRLCLNLNAADNLVSIKIPKRLLSSSQFRSLTNEIDNVNFDVLESFKSE